MACLQYNCLYTSNTVLNNKKNYMLGKIWSFCLKNFSLKCHWKFGRVWHTLSAMLLYQWHHRYVTITTMTSYWCLSDITEITFCQGIKYTSFNSIVSMVTDLWCHLRGAWHIVYAMLLSNPTYNSRGKERKRFRFYSPFKNISLI